MTSLYFNNDVALYLLCCIVSSKKICCHLYLFSSIRIIFFNLVGFKSIPIPLILSNLIRMCLDVVLFVSCDCSWLFELFWFVVFIILKNCPPYVFFLPVSYFFVNFGHMCISHCEIVQELTQTLFIYFFVIFFLCFFLCSISWFSNSKIFLASMSDLPLITACVFPVYVIFSFLKTLGLFLYPLISF